MQQSKIAIQSLSPMLYQNQSQDQRVKEVKREKKSLDQILIVKKKE